MEKTIKIYANWNQISKHPHGLGYPQGKPLKAFQIIVAVNPELKN